MAKETKLRPVITPQQLTYIIDTISQDNNSTTQKIKENLLQYLKVFQLKANLGVVSAAYTSAPKRLSIEDQLDDDNTPAARREAAYALWQQNPELCTPEQLALVATYRYENNLMSPEEEEEFES